MNLSSLGESNLSGLLDITPFVMEHKPEILENRDKKFWVTPQFMFKRFFKHEFECYSDIFNKLLMPKMGLHNSCDYRMVTFDNKTGVVTERINNENETFFMIFDIMQHYNFYNFSLEIIDELIKHFCLDNDYTYTNEIKSELEKLYLYDLLTMQQDRGPLNFGIVIDQDKQAKLVYYDHANMMFMGEDDLIQRFKNGDYTVQEFDENRSETRLLLSSSDSMLWKQPKLEFIRSYLENADEEQLNLFQEMIDMYNDETVHEVFEEMEDENGIMVPPLFKRLVFEEVKYIRHGIYSFNIKKSKKID